MMRSHDYDAIVIGGGFFGCCLALHIRHTRNAKVAVLEREPELLQRASYCNQARVHAGYHYPRSILTGLRSQVNFPRFSEQWADCVDNEFEAYYAVARQFSNVTAVQFRLFCERIGAPVEPAPESVKRLFSTSLVEDVFRVTEYAFDSTKLKDRLLAEMQQAGVEICFETEALAVGRSDAGGLSVLSRTNDGELGLTAGSVFNCTYARTNRLLRASDLPLVPLKHELTEVALVKVPEELENRAVTLMCGPFFGVMPFPARGLHSLYHVRYTLHGVWHDADPDQYRDPYEMLEHSQRESRYKHMVKDAERYLPCMVDCDYEDSLWEVRTVLPISEYDDSRPILYVEDCGLEGLTCILGAKIDNIYDMIDFVQQPC
ncbi:MAG: FAD-dependent oxidoreductase [Planctomycetota bacterium]|nr:FAD-dependent oxidoreductase [Planctomycetota bacterium]